MSRFGTILGDTQQASQPANPAAPPFVRFTPTILIDQREKLPYEFANLRSDKSEGGHPILVGWRTAHLETGDYTLEGCAARCAVERKSLEDLYSTLGQHRDRFEAELHRLNQIEFAHVIVEAGWQDIWYDPPAFSKLVPKTIGRSVIAWSLRFPRVHWWTMPDRRHAEAWTFQLLRRFWKEEQGS